MKGKQRTPNRPKNYKGRADKAPQGVTAAQGKEAYDDKFIKAILKGSTDEMRRERRKPIGNFARGPVLSSDAEQHHIDKAVKEWVKGDIDIVEGRGEDMKSRNRSAMSGGRKGKDVDRVVKSDPRFSGKIIPYNPESVLEPGTYEVKPGVGFRRLDKLTLADRVYGMAANGKFLEKVDIAATDKQIFKNRNFRGIGFQAYLNGLRNNMRRAEKIVLEDDFVRQVVQVCTPEGRIDINQIQNALTLGRNPFHRTWIEWNARVMLDERVKIGTLGGVENDAPTNMGALCISSSDDGSEYYVDEFADNTKDILPTVFSYGINTEQAIQIPKLRIESDGVRMNINNPQYKATLLFGYMPHLPFIDWKPLEQISIDMNELIYAGTFRTTTSEQMDDLIEGNVREAAGAIKFILTALALINSAKIQYNVVSIPSGRRLSSGKSLPYMEHRTVKIQVPAGKKDITKYLNSILKIEGARKRAHKVRGFWRTLDQGTSSERKVWVKPHVRGDASLGWVNQDHLVTT